MNHPTSAPLTAHSAEVETQRNAAHAAASVRASAAASLATASAQYAGVRPPAMVMAAFDASGVIAWHGAGEPRLDGAPVTRETVFRIASMTKSILAATALALAESGTLDLSAGIDRYLPGVRFLHRGVEQRVTVADLLANRSGMPEDNAWADRQLGASIDYIASLFAEGIELAVAPGVRFQYSNLGMSLVGRVIESIVSRPIEEEIRARFLDPLGLSHTRFAREDYPAGTDIAHGFRSFDEGATFVPEPFIGEGALAAIGGLFSTVDDIARWGWFLASAFTDSPLKPELLSARGRIEMQRAHTPIPVPQPTAHRDLQSLGYGLGLIASYDRALGPIVDHSGGLPGFSSNMRWHTDSGIGIVAFGNSDACRAETLAVAAHAEVMAAAAVPPLTVRPWPLALEAGELLDDLLRDGGALTEAARVTSANFFADAPDEIRRRRVAALLAEVGDPTTPMPFATRIIGASDAAHLRWRIDCERGALVCDIRLIGLNEPLVQSLTVAIADDAGRAPRTGEPGLQVLSAVVLDGASIS